jgi:hypothetical protein
MKMKNYGSELEDVKKENLKLEKICNALRETIIVSGIY